MTELLSDPLIRVALLLNVTLFLLLFFVLLHRLQMQQSAEHPEIAGGRLHAASSETVLHAVQDTADSPDVTDVAEQELTIKALREERALFAQIADMSPICITKVDATGQIVFANPQAEVVLGITRSDVQQRSFDDPVWRITDVEGGPFPEEALPFAVVRDTLQPVHNVQHAIVWPDGSRRILSVNASPILGATGTFEGMVSVIEDITERKEMERQREAAIAAKQQLMREMNHRVKNNLNMVSSLISLKEQSHGASADLSDIRGQVSTIAYLHEKLYETDNVSSVQLRPYLEDLLRELFSFYREAEVRLTIEGGNRSLPTSTVTSLGLILNEIATNAMKYGFKRGETPCFSVRMEDDTDAATHRITVTQSGHSFPEKVTVHGANSSGLQLIEVLVSQLNGSVKLIREPVTQFRIRIPV